MNGKILLVITALFVMVSSVWGAKTEIPDLKVIAKSKYSYIYSGHVILIETGKPMSEGFIYLVAQGGRKIIASTALAYDGYFELQGPKKGLPLLIATSEVRQREASKDEVKFLRELDEKIEKLFDEKKYGRKALIMRDSAQIVIYPKETVLTAERNFNFKSEDIILGESYDCLEAACALKHYVAALPQFHQAYLCRFSFRESCLSLLGKRLAHTTRIRSCTTYLSMLN